MENKACNYFVVGLSHVEFHPPITIARGPLAGKKLVMSFGAGVEMSKNPDRPVERRVFGYFPTEEQARDAVKADTADFNEAGKYEYLVIEEVPPGVHPNTRDVQWYRHFVALPGKRGERIRGRFEPINKPKDAAAGTNFSIG